jgi:hypothetical protein
MKKYKGIVFKKKWNNDWGYLWETSNIKRKSIGYYGYLYIKATLKKTNNADDDFVASILATYKEIKDQTTISRIDKHCQGFQDAKRFATFIVNNFPDHMNMIEK